MDSEQLVEKLRAALAISDEEMAQIYRLSAYQTKHFDLNGVDGQVDAGNCAADTNRAFTIGHRSVNLDVGLAGDEKIETPTGREKIVASSSSSNLQGHAVLGHFHASRIIFPARRDKVLTLALGVEMSHDDALDAGSRRDPAHLGRNQVTGRLLAFRKGALDDASSSVCTQQPHRGM